MSRIKPIDLDRVKLHPHSELDARLTSDQILPLKKEKFNLDAATLREIDAAIRLSAGYKSRILFMGAHLIKLGLSEYLCDLLRRGYFSHVAINGAALIHDWQLTCHGKTDENVPATLSRGRFGFWQELDHMNKFAKAAATNNASIAAMMGAHLDVDGMFFTRSDTATARRQSLIHTCFSNEIPVTVHALIGADILTNYPDFDGAAWGALSHRDYKVFAAHLCNDRERHVFFNVGSAETGPEVLLKALSLGANLGKMPRLNTVVMDLFPLPHDWRNLEEHPVDALYYWRPWKTVLQRAIKHPEGCGDSAYIRGDLKYTFRHLWTGIIA